jgi:hypothetical protein
MLSTLLSASSNEALGLIEILEIRLQIELKGDLLLLSPLLCKFG